MKKYLVTGGAGFIGSNFVKYLLKEHGQDVEILVLDALTYAGNLLTIKDELELPNVSFVKGDIGDAQLVEKLMADFDPDYVVNFAAESHVDRSISNPRLFLETNILGTQTLLNAARQAWLIPGKPGEAPKYREGKKYHQISTDEVYGSLSREPGEPKPLVLTEAVANVVKGRDNLQTFGNGFFTEKTPLSPRSPYSVSKTSADMLVMAYHETYGLPVTITRCSNNYGPYHFPEKLIPLVIKNILEGKKLPVYGKGENVRDWLYVEDHCKGIDMVLRNGRIGEVYNIGGFNEEQLAIPVEDINEELISYVTDRPGHDMRYAIDPEKIATELGWYPETSFREGILKTVKWNLDNRDWIDSVSSGEYQKFYEQLYGNR
jgi:dTDP-glucose 4,6-dehydratase